MRDDPNIRLRFATNVKNTGFTYEITRLTTTPTPPPFHSVCPLNTSPCVRSKRHRVCGHHAHMGKPCVRVVPVHMGTF